MLRAAVTAVAWSSVGYRLVLLRFTASPPNRTLLAIVAFPAVAATAGLPSVYVWLGRLTEVPNAGILVQTSFGLLALVPCLNMLLLRADDLSVRHRRARRRYLVAFALVAAQVWLWSGTAGKPADPLFGLTRVDSPRVVAYLMVHQLALACTGVVCLVQCGRAARAADGLARWGLRAVGASGLLAVLVVATNAFYYGSALRGEPIRAQGLGLLSVWMVYLAVGALAMGVTVPDWAPRVASLVRGCRQLRAIEPAWRTMVLAVPEVRLDAGYSAWDVQRRLHRRVVEIHDAELALRRARPSRGDKPATPAELLRARKLAAAVRHEESRLRKDEAASLAHEVDALVRASESVGLRRAARSQQS